MSEHLNRDEWEALRLLNRESGAAPGQAMMVHLGSRRLINADLSLTDAGRAALEAFTGRYPDRPVGRNFIGNGR